MARSDHRRSRQWRFSDSRSRFTKKRQGPTVDRHPISSAFPRKIIHCRRCGTRIVSNISYCPFCGKSVLPFFRKLWFWLIVLAVLAVGFIALLLYVPLTPEPEDETANQLPVVVGAPEGTSYKDLPPNTTIDANNLLVTVTDVTGGLIASDGKPIIAVEIQFFNKGDHAITVYSTQWMMEDATGARVDCFIGKTDTGETIATLETSDLAVGAQRTTTFYFSGEDLTRVLFLPDALSYEENDLVSWFVPPASDEEESN